MCVLCVCLCVLAVGPFLEVCTRVCASIDRGIGVGQLPCAKQCGWIEWNRADMCPMRKQKIFRCRRRMKPKPRTPQINDIITRSPAHSLINTIVFMVSKSVCSTCLLFFCCVVLCHTRMPSISLEWTRVRHATRSHSTRYNTHVILSRNVCIGHSRAQLACVCVYHYSSCYFFLLFSTA